MDTQKSLEKINNSKINPALEKKMLEYKRYSASIDLLEDISKKYPLPEDRNCNVPLLFLQQLLTTQSLMIVSGIYLTIDWKTNEYYIIDMQTGKEVRLSNSEKL